MTDVAEIARYCREFDRMTSTDTLLPCPFCGGEAIGKSRHTHEPAPRYALACVDCFVATEWQSTPTDANAAWNRRTPPTPTTDANPFVGTNWQVRSDTPTPATEEREALGATVSAFWDTKDTVESCINAVLSALAPYRAAEILAAEARGMGRARTVVQNTRDGMKFDPNATLEWRNAITGGFNAADLALRHELDAMEDFDD